LERFLKEDAMAYFKVISLEGLRTIMNTSVRIVGPWADI
jgi:hypothetical protein